MRSTKKPKPIAALYHDGGQLEYFRSASAAFRKAVLEAATSSNANGKAHHVLRYMGSRVVLFAVWPDENKEYACGAALVHTATAPISGDVDRCITPAPEIARSY